MTEITAIEAFIKAQKEMKTPVFNNVNPHFKNKFADLLAIANSCKKALLDNNLTQIQRYGFVDSVWGVLTSILYKDGTVISDSFYPINVSLNDQQKGSATTYGRRYSLAMACNLVAEEDDDGGRAAASETKVPVKQITSEHYKILQALIDTKKDVNVKKMCNHYKIDALAQLPLERYKSAYDALNAKEDK
tara:strand:- start:1229 stop:1798 length:570 start_codon:yes stop_codon:yes gene_type:complete